MICTKFNIPSVSERIQVFLMEITLFSSTAFVFKMVLSLRFHIGSHVNEQLIFLLYITFRLKHFGHRFIIEVKCDFLCLYALFLFYSRGGGGNNLSIFIYDALCICFARRFHLLFNWAALWPRFRYPLKSIWCGGSLCRNRFIYLFAPKRDHIGEPEKIPFFWCVEKVCCRCCCCLLPSNLTLWTAWN